MVPARLQLYCQDPGSAGVYIMHVGGSSHSIETKIQVHVASLFSRKWSSKSLPIKENKSNAECKICRSFVFITTFVPQKMDPSPSVRRVAALPHHQRSNIVTVMSVRVVVVVVGRHRNTADDLKWRTTALYSRGYILEQSAAENESSKRTHLVYGRARKYHTSPANPHTGRNDAAAADVAVVLDGDRGTNRQSTYATTGAHVCGQCPAVELHIWSNHCPLADRDQARVLHKAVGLNHHIVVQSKIVAVLAVEGSFNVQKVSQVTGRTAVAWSRATELGLDNCFEQPAAFFLAGTLAWADGFVVALKGSLAIISVINQLRVVPVMIRQPRQHSLPLAHSTHFRWSGMTCHDRAAGDQSTWSHWTAVG